MEPVYATSAQYSVSSVATSPFNNLTSTTDTIQIMRRLVQESLGTVQVERVAREIAKGLPPEADEVDVARAAFWWVKSHIRLKEDEATLTNDFGIDPSPSGSELLLSPAFVLSLPKGSAVGDCDDFSTTLVTLLLKLGIHRSNVFFVTVAADGNNPTAFSHVYCGIKTHDGEWYGLDCSHGPFPGWEVNRVYDKRFWNV